MNRGNRRAHECAQCGEFLFLPEWSEYVDRNSVRHLWKCHACGSAFETTARFAIDVNADDPVEVAA